MTVLGTIDYRNFSNDKKIFISSVEGSSPPRSSESGYDYLTYSGVGP